MKKILIIGKNSYLGKSFADHLKNHDLPYQVDMISAKSGEWENFDYSGYDSVVMFSGIAHRKEQKGDEQLYFATNADLAEKICKKAKQNGVKQFVYLSSMSVYGISTGIITKNTLEKPTTYYGKSKLLGEKLIFAMQSDDFAVCAVRAPMVYGKNCTGNYKRLSALTKKLPFAPDFSNKRSMIYVQNLCEHLRILCENRFSGIFCPQNSEYICTTALISEIARCNGRSIKKTKLFNPLIKLLVGKVPTINKLFGSLVYEKSMSQIENCDYNIVGFEQSIALSERN